MQTQTGEMLPVEGRSAGTLPAVKRRFKNSRRTGFLTGGLAARSRLAGNRETRPQGRQVASQAKKKLPPLSARQFASLEQVSAIPPTFASRRSCR